MDPSEIISQYGLDCAKQIFARTLRKLYNASLFDTAKTLLGYNAMTVRTHGPIVQVLEDESTRKLICVPRGCFKSSLAAVAFPIWLLNNNPNLRILIDSEIYTNSATFLREIKAHLSSERLTNLYGQYRNESNWNEGEITIRQRTQPKKEASITCGGIGTTKVGQHYDVIIGDDYNSPKNTATVDGRKKVIDHIRYNTSILEPGGTYVFTATRYHDEDAAGFILKDLMCISVQEALERTKNLRRVA